MATSITEARRNGRRHYTYRDQSKQGYILDVGCGRDKHPGAVGMDRQALDGVDVVHDWNVFPWPFEDESCLAVLASHVVEHINPADGHFLRWMDEVWRILKPDRQFAAVMPYAGSTFYWQDPTHINGCTERTWTYFDPLNEWGFWSIYSPKPWKIEQNLFHSEGMLEVVMRKRLEDPDSWQ